MPFDYRSSLDRLGMTLSNVEGSGHPEQRRGVRLFVVLATIGMLPVIGGAQQGSSGAWLVQVDHIVYTTPDLQVGIDAIEKLLGVRATPGGQHPGMGTRNALVSLGPSTYLEIIGPDPEQPAPSGPRRFGIDSLKAPRVFTWVAKGTKLESFAAKAAQGGIKLGDVISGSRRRPDGVVLTWRYTDPNIDVADRIVPYFIDWGSSPHPAITAAPGASLVALRAEHPDAERVQKTIAQLGLALPIRPGSRPVLIATIKSPRGQVELR